METISILRLESGVRILMFGRGTIATIYGHVLQEAGHDVEFYVRPGRAAELGDTVEIDLLDARRTPLGTRVRGTFPIRLRESVSADDGFDLIVLSVGHHHLSEAAEFLAPRLGGATVLVFGNIWEEPLAAVAPLPADRVVFGFGGGGGGFGGDGVLHAALMRSVIIGMTGVRPSQRELGLQAAFRQAGLATRTEKDMRGRLWVHFVSDAGMLSQAIRSGSMAKMIGDRRAFRNAFLTSRELLPLLKARGVDLRRHRVAILPYRFPGLVAALTALATTRMRIAQVSLAAHTDPRAPEARAVLDDTVREARRLGVPVPRLDL